VTNGKPYRNEQNIRALKRVEARAKPPKSPVGKWVLVSDHSVSG